MDKERMEFESFEFELEKKGIQSRVDIENVEFRKRSELQWEGDNKQVSISL